MTKKVIPVLIILLLSIILTVNFAVGTTNIIIDGKTIIYNDDSGYPFVDENGRTQVPFRLTLETYGAVVSWNSDTRSAIATKGDIKIEVPIGEAYIKKNDLIIQNDTSSLIKAGRTYLPIRIVMESMNSIVSWDNESRSVIIESTPITNEGQNEAIVEENTVNIENQNYISSRKIDLRDTIALSPIKDQGRSGSCWAFASMGAIESRLSPLGIYDLSEDNLILNNPYIADYDSGGYRGMSVSYLASWSGPVLESDDKFGDNIINYDAKEAFHLQDALYIENSIIEFKTALINYGPIHCGIYANDPDSGEIDDDYFNVLYNAYRYDGDKEANHDVVIIGWDDDFPKEYFPKIPSANGAYIVRNSWGEDWGEEGYYYVSYYDSQMGVEATVYSNLESNTNYDWIYQYDYSGANSSIGYSDTYAYMVNIFYKTTSNQELSAVSFYTLGKNTDYKIYYVDKYMNTVDFEKMIEITVGTIEYEGYHTIDFDNILLDDEGKFAIIVYLNTPEQVYPLPINVANDETKKTDSNPEESYISYDAINWEDIIDTMPTGNAALKAFTENQ